MHLVSSLLDCSAVRVERPCLSHKLELAWTLLKLVVSIFIPKTNFGLCKIYCFQHTVTSTIIGKNYILVTFVDRDFYLKFEDPYFTGGDSDQVDNGFGYSYIMIF